MSTKTFRVRIKNIIDDGTLALTIQPNSLKLSLVEIFFELNLHPQDPYTFERIDGGCSFAVLIHGLEQYIIELLDCRTADALAFEEYLSPYSTITGECPVLLVLLVQRANSTHC